VAQATGLGERTIRRGCKEMLQEPNPHVYAGGLGIQEAEESR